MSIVTQELLETGMSSNGGWNSAQLHILLPAWEFENKSHWPKSGWKNRILGREINQSQYEEFLRLKDKHLVHKRRDKISPQAGYELFQQRQHLASIKAEIRSA